MKSVSIRQWIAVNIGSLVLVVLCANRAAAELQTDLVIVTNGFRQTSPAGLNYFMGNVGIGTNDPNALLHVAGDAAVDGALRIQVQGDIPMGVYTNENVSGPFMSAQTNVVVKAYRSSDVAITRNVWTKLPMNAEWIDTRGAYNPSTYNFTAPVSGRYFFHAQAKMPMEASRFCGLRIRSSTSTYSEAYGFEAGEPTFSISCVEYVAAGTQMYVEMLHNNSANYSMRGGRTLSSFHVIKVD